MQGGTLRLNKELGEGERLGLRANGGYGRECGERKDRSDKKLGCGGRTNWLGKETRTKSQEEED